MFIPWELKKKVLVGPVTVQTSSNQAFELHRIPLWERTLNSEQRWCYMPRRGLPALVYMLWNREACTKGSPWERIPWTWLQHSTSARRAWPNSPYRAIFKHSCLPRHLIPEICCHCSVLLTVSHWRPLGDGNVGHKCNTTTNHHHHHHYCLIIIIAKNLISPGTGFAVSRTSPFLGRFVVHALALTTLAMATVTWMKTKTCRSKFLSSCHWRDTPGCDRDTRSWQSWAGPVGLAQVTGAAKQSLASSFANPRENECEAVRKTLGKGKPGLHVLVSTTRRFGD